MSAPCYAGGVTTTEPPGIKVWQQAATFAAWKHRHQLRKDGRTPYVAHPFRVAMAVRQIFGCEDPAALAAALLHDTIEDTCTDYDELQEIFGDEIAGIVAALTKNMALPKEEREAEYDRRLARADWRAKLIKLGDVYDNLSDMPDRSPEKLAKVHDKCRRAIRIAQLEAGKHDPIARAITAVENLMAAG